MTAPICDCHAPNAKVKWRDPHNIGVTDRFWELSAMTCDRCGTTWLRAFLEHEAFSRSGRYYRAPVSAFKPIDLSPETALSLIEAAPFKIAGGSRFDGQEQAVTDAGKLLEAP